MSEEPQVIEKREKKRVRLSKSDRREQILLELKLHPHVRISELADKFNVSAETVRRDFDKLAGDGLISRAFGGASAPSSGFYPSLTERTNARSAERARIGMKAANLVGEGETVMIDSGSTTIQMSRSLAYLGTPCTIITNSLPVAMTSGRGATKVILCPGEYLAAESAVIGTETVDFLSQFNVDRCMIGASGLSAYGPSETVTGFAAVKRMMLRCSAKRHLLIDSIKFGAKGLAKVGDLTILDSIITDTAPKDKLSEAIQSAQVDLIVA